VALLALGMPCAVLPATAGEAPRAAPSPASPASPAAFDETDELAALEAVRYALSEVGDGATYVWHREGGQLSGLFRPTQSFFDADGRVCRHLIMTLAGAGRSSTVEGIACRLPSGQWQLDG
jgi:surface antigen